MPQVEEPNDKVREQIEEILENTERTKPEPIRIARPVTPRKVRSGTPLWYPTPEKLIAAGLVLMLIAVITRSFVLPLTVAGFAVAGIGYYLLIQRKRRAKYGVSSGGIGDSSPKYWRGKPIDSEKRSKPSTPVTRRDGNIIDFPDPDDAKSKRRFGRKR